MNGLSFSTIIVLVVTLLCSLAFLSVSSKQSEKTVNRPLYVATWAFWLIVPLIANIVVVRWLFRPVSYLVILTIVCAMEILTIRTPERKDATEVENPNQRFLAWFLFSLWPQISMIICGTTLEGEWRFGGSKTPLYFIPLVIIAAIGCLCLATCKAPDDDTDEDEDESEDANFDEISADDLEEADDVEELDELEEIDPTDGEAA